jgi:glycosyltransferase involved in cell wall biosynthesis
MKSKVNLISPINQLGYGLVGLNILRALSEFSEVSFWPIGAPECDPSHHDLVKTAIKNSHTPDFTAPCIRIWHQNDMAQFVGSGLKIGFPIFELDRFNDIERHHLRHLDKIFVCSSWAKDVCIEQEVVSEENIHVIPLGVDSGLFASVFQDKPDNDKKTIFFNCGKWEVRKGHDILVKAFNKAFSREDNVELWMLCTNIFFSENENLEWQNLYTSSDLGEKVFIIPRQQSQKDVYNIMRKTDCGVFPARAEGWNLELLEMMACGKHVIATNYSAHTEFCNEQNCLLVEAKEKEEAFDGKWFKGQGNWAKISESEIESISKHMQLIHESKQNNTLGVNHAGLETAKKYSWNNSAREIINALSKSQ